MGDLLSEIKEVASVLNPVLFTVATLTGHAARSMGPYTIFSTVRLAYYLSPAMGLWADRVRFLP